MIGLIENQVVVIEPLLDVGGRFQLRHGVNGAGVGRIYVYYDTMLVEAGVTFYLMKGKADLDPRTGRFTLKTPSATIRAVFAGQHHDIEVTR